tara:strand:+ start:51 stop:716 length:666 start_codon:yes stop_codon:yes gene_type:complete
MPDAGYPVDKEQQQTQQLEHPNANLQPLLEFHVSDDPAETKESDQLQKTKKLELSIGSFAIDDHKPSIQILKGYTSRQIHKKPTCDDIIPSYFTGLNDFKTCLGIYKSSPKSNNDINGEANIDEILTCYINVVLLSLKGNIERNRDAVPHGQQHNIHIPFHTVVIIVSQRPLRNLNLILQELLLHGGDVFFLLVLVRDVLFDLLGHRSLDDGIDGLMAFLL